MLAWEKVITWILVLVVIIVIAIFLVNQLGSGDGSVMTRFFGAANSTKDAFPGVGLG